MIYLATVVSVAVVVFIVTDALRGRSLRRRMLAATEDLGSEFAQIRNTAEALRLLGHQFDARARAAQIQSSAPEYTYFPDFSAVVLENPYTRLSVESGIRRIVAAISSSGEVSIREVESPSMTLVEEFPLSLAKTTALDLVTSIIEDYKQLALRKPTQLPRAPRRI